MLPCDAIPDTSRFPTSQSRDLSLHLLPCCALRDSGGLLEHNKIKAGKGLCGMRPHGTACAKAAAPAPIQPAGSVLFLGFFMCHFSCSCTAPPARSDNGFSLSDAEGARQPQQDKKAKDIYNCVIKWLLCLPGMSLLGRWLRCQCNGSQGDRGLLVAPSPAPRPPKPGRAANPSTRSSAGALGRSLLPAAPTGPAWDCHLCPRGVTSGTADGGSDGDSRSRSPRPHPCSLRLAGTRHPLFITPEL